MIDEKKLIEELKSEYMHFSLLDMNKMGHETACHRSGINCGILTAIRRVEQQPKVGEWIPCSERLPVPNEYDETGKFFKAYLVQDKRKTMYTALWNGENWVLWTRNIRIENVIA